MKLIRISYLLLIAAGFTSMVTGCSDEPENKDYATDTPTSPEEENKPDDENKEEEMPQLPEYDPFNKPAIDFTGVAIKDPILIATIGKDLVNHLNFYCNPRFIDSIYEGKGIDWPYLPYRVEGNWELHGAVCLSEEATDMEISQQTFPEIWKYQIGDYYLANSNELKAEWFSFKMEYTLKASGITLSERVRLHFAMDENRTFESRVVMADLWNRIDGQPVRAIVLFHQDGLTVFPGTQVN